MLTESIDRKYTVDSERVSSKHNQHYHVPCQSPETILGLPFCYLHPRVPFCVLTFFPSQDTHIFSLSSFLAMPINLSCCSNMIKIFFSRSWKKIMIVSF